MIAFKFSKHSSLWSSKPSNNFKKIKNSFQSCQVFNQSKYFSNFHMSSVWTPSKSCLEWKLNFIYYISSLQDSKFSEMWKVNWASRLNLRIFNFHAISIWIVLVWIQELQIDSFAFETLKIYSDRIFEHVFNCFRNDRNSLKVKNEICQTYVFTLLKSLIDIEKVDFEYLEETFVSESNQKRLNPSQSSIFLWIKTKSKQQKGELAPTPRDRKTMSSFLSNMLSQAWALL